MKFRGLGRTGRVSTPMPLPTNLATAHALILRQRGGVEQPFDGQESPKRTPDRAGGPRSRTQRWLFLGTDGSTAFGNNSRVLPRNATWDDEDVAGDCDRID